MPVPTLNAGFAAASRQGGNLDQMGRSVAGLNSNSRSGDRCFNLTPPQCRHGESEALASMMDTITNNNEGHAELFTHRRTWEMPSNRRSAPTPERMIATARRVRSVLVLVALSMLSWGVVVLAIEALANV
jgi:hypothetical protein